jgi:RNA polymerase sigma-70 factor (ECF subfamily)
MAERLEQRFLAVLGAHGPAISRVIRAYARDAAERADLEQEIALALWMALPTFREECAERTFVLRIAHNRALSFLTQHARRVESPLPEALVAPAADPEQRATGAQRLDALQRALQKIPLGPRQVLLLALEGLRHEEIAQVLGITANNAAVRLSRARAALRELMGGEP